ncbi:MAG: YitT family protein [Lacticaseibacillus songhuajiangensis]|jgi:uncharacterized membrane-anchored protein YitT (DUF2179 family)|nr:YitT family protein [Lacticaseibacillus songhuajiangensis]
MDKIRSNQWLKLGFITAALAVIALSINLFFAPHGVAAGGATGLAIIVYELAKIPTAITTLVINLLLLILSAFLLPKATTLRIVYGSFMLPVLMALIPTTKIVADRTLAVMVGSVVIALGFTMLYAVDASSGGTTVPPLIFKRYWNVKTATSLFVTDVVVSSLNIPVSGLEAFILAIFSLGITNVAMNYMQTGLDRKRMLHVFSHQRLGEINRKLAEIPASHVETMLVSGTDDGAGQDMLLVVIDQQYYKYALHVIRALDKQAIIVAGEVAEVHGVN